MKSLSFALLASTIAAHAEFSQWSNKAGKSAELDLLKVVEQAGTKVGHFKTKAGQDVQIKAADLSEADGKRLAEWKEAGPSVFDEFLSGNIENLDGKKFKATDKVTPPAKYYIFYYTASWCGPCQAFTPSLVDFYNKKKNANFEIILVTSDKDEESMLHYAIDKKMPWKFLKLKKVDSFVNKFNHGVTGIPSVITCDLQGNIISKTNDISELEALVK